MANHRINYSAKTFELLSQMPDFVSDFIINFGQVESYATKYQYARDIKDFLCFMIQYLPAYCDKPLSELTLTDMDRIQPIDVNRYLTLLAGNGENGLKMTTIKRRRASLSSMYHFFQVNKKVQGNPVLATKPIRLPAKDLVYLTNEEQRLLLQTVRWGTSLSDATMKRHNLYADRDSSLFLLLLDTGLRVSELVSTDISDYDLEECSVVVKRKGGDIQTVYYSDECALYLHHYFESQLMRFPADAPSIPAFTTTSGNRLGVRAVETLVKKYAAASLPEKAKQISPHKLRSSFAMSFYEASNKDILLLQKKLNHKSLTTTNIYAKASDQAMKESRSLLQGLR